MVRHIACLRGWHPALARAEIAALLPEMAITRLEGRRLLSLEGSTDEMALSQAVAVSSGCQAILCEAIVCSGEGDALIDRLMPAILEYLNNHPRDGTVAVRAWRHEGRIEGVGPSHLAQQIGGRMHDLGYAIDLERPQHRFGVVIDASSHTITCGWMLGFGNESDGVSSRKAAERPFFKPVSLDPRLARLAVNLASGPVGNGATIDVMTGTGGFLIEAALSDRIAVGLDLNPEMVEGTIQNLEWALNAEGKTEHNAMVLVGDATSLQDALSELDAPACGFVLDPPYGRNSQGSLEPMALLESVLTSAHEVAQAGAGLVLILPIHPMGEHPDEPIPNAAGINLLHGDWQGIERALTNAYWSIQNRWVEHVHASLSRLILHATVAPQD
jgi:tRNA (guanine10-N2)-dimethyltransferase